MSSLAPTQGSINSNNISTPKFNTVDPKTGDITPHFQRQADLVGIVFNQKDIETVNATLQTNGCFQKDPFFYENGGISPFSSTLTYEQAKAFLDDEYSDRAVQMPSTKEIVNGVIACGVEPTMHKRFNSLNESIKQGHRYDVIHFVVQNAKGAELTSKLIDTTYKNLLEGIKTNIVVADCELNWVEEGFKILSNNKTITHGYSLISDPTFASKVESIAVSIFKGIPCYGVASAPIKDWKFDMDLYNYTTKLGSHEKAAVAWTAAAWNFKARDVNTDLRNYKAQTVKVDSQSSSSSK